MGAAHQNRAAVGALGLPARSRDGTLQANHRGRLLGVFGQGPTPERWNEWIRGHWRIENGSHYVRDVAFAEDASRIRKNANIVARLRSFAYNLLRAEGCDNIKNARWRAAIDIEALLKMRQIR